MKHDCLKSVDEIEFVGTLAPSRPLASGSRAECWLQGAAALGPDFMRPAIANDPMFLDLGFTPALPTEGRAQRRSWLGLYLAYSE